MNDITINKSKENSNLQDIKVQSIEKHKEFVFITLVNYQRIIITKDRIYDLTGFDYIEEIFYIKDRLYVVISKRSIKSLVDLETREIIFSDENAAHISKIGGTILRVMMRKSNEHDYLYNVESKNRIIIPEGYKYNIYLGNNLVTLEDKNDELKSVYESKKIVINSEGKVIFEAVGWVELYDNHLVVQHNNGFKIISIKEDSSVDIKEFINTQDTKHIYNKGKIYIINNKVLKIYNVKLELIKEIPFDNIERIIKQYVINEIILLTVIQIIDGEEVEKLLLINSRTGTMRTHLYVEISPYNNPKYYICRDAKLDYTYQRFELNNHYKLIDYYFYDKDLNLIAKLQGHVLKNIDDNSLFELRTWTGKEFQYTYINCESREVKKSKYDQITFHDESPYGYAINLETDMLEIIDRDLNVIISNIDYKELDLFEGINPFGVPVYFVNNYVYFKSNIADGPYTHTRYVLVNKAGKVIIDSINCRILPFGIYIQIITGHKTEFLNTVTGERGELSISAPTNEYGLINVNNLQDINKSLRLTSNNEGFKLPDKAFTLNNNS